MRDKRHLSQSVKVGPAVRPVHVNEKIEKKPGQHRTVKNTRMCYI